jgi:RNA polymerase sigma-70 factor (ECF subfamily)
MHIPNNEPELRVTELGVTQLREFDLVEKVKDGEITAFEELERRYRPKILNQLRRLCHDEHEAEDILQDVMMTLYLKLDTFEGKSTLSTWIYRIALNAFLMHERKQKRQQLFFMDDEPLDSFQERSILESETDSCAYSHLASNEFQVTLAKAVSELPKGYREVFLMRNHDDLPIKEVSRRLGISVPAVKSRNRRARQFLQSRLRAYDYN